MAVGVGANATNEDRTRWSWIGVPAGIAVASRAFSLALVLVANALNRVPRRNPFDAWDAGWYLSIANTGYHATPHQITPTAVHYDFAFFPLWPAVIRASTLGFLPDGATSVVAANLLFVGAAVIVWRLLADRFAPEVATGAVLLLAFCPPAYVFSLAYSEPLFLVVASLYFLSRRASARRGLFAALAMVTRIAGAAVVASALVQAIRTRGEERRVAVAAALVGSAAFAGWWIFIAFLTHDPLGFLHGSPGWGRSNGLVALVSQLRRPTIERYAWAAFVGLMFVGTLLLVRRDVELGLYAAAALALCLVPGGVLGSMPRYALAAFPAFAGIADRLGRRGTRALVVVFALGQWWFVSWAFTGPGAQPP
jgi:hypothetical protein